MSERIEHLPQSIDLRFEHSTGQTIDAQPHGLSERDSMPVLFEHTDPHPDRREIDDIHEVLGRLDVLSDRQIGMHDDAANHTANRQSQRHVAVRGQRLFADT